MIYQNYLHNVQMILQSNFVNNDDTSKDIQEGNTNPFKGIAIAMENN